MKDIAESIEEERAKVEARTPITEEVRACRAGVPYSCTTACHLERRGRGTVGSVAAHQERGRCGLACCSTRHMTRVFCGLPCVASSWVRVRPISPASRPVF